MEKSYLKVKKLNPNAKLPTKRVEDACYDMYGIYDEDPKFLYPGDIYLIPLGIAIEFPKDWIFYIIEKSSAGSKGISTRAGVIDSGYRGEVKTPLNNTTNKLIVCTNKTEEEIRKNYADKIKGYENKLVFYPQTKSVAQGALMYCPHVDIEEVHELDETSQRGTGAWGSTGK